MKIISNDDAKALYAHIMSNPIHQLKTNLNETVNQCCEHDAINCFELLIDNWFIGGKTYASYEILDNAIAFDAIKIFTFIIEQHFCGDLNTDYLLAIIDMANRCKAEAICKFLQMKIRQQKIKNLVAE